MNIEKYVDDFHDGGLIDIEHRNDEIELSIESSEMDLCDMKDPIEMSDRLTIKGKLHLKGINFIKVNDITLVDRLKKTYDSGGIVDLEINKNRVEISVSWYNSPPKPSVNDFSIIEIEAEEVWWENIPDLVDPFW